MDDSGHGRQYDERDVALILKRAAEIQDGPKAEGRGRLTLEEVRQIALEVGIDPRHVTEAAASLEARAGSRRGFLGAPTRFQNEVVLDREISDGELGGLIDAVRGVLALQGKTTQGLDTVEWAAQEATGGYYLTATRRDGRTRVRLSTHRADLAMIVTMGIAMAGFGATIVTGVTAGLEGPAVTGLLAGGALGTYGAMRVVWTGIANRWEARLRTLASLVRGSVAERPAPPPVGAGAKNSVSGP